MDSKLDPLPEAKTANCVIPNDRSSLAFRFFMQLLIAKLTQTPTDSQLIEWEIRLFLLDIPVPKYSENPEGSFMDEPGNC